MTSAKMPTQFADSTRTTPPRILIFGTGSVGAIYAYILSRAIPSTNIYCVCRSNYDVASTSGFTINSSIFGQNLNVRPRIVKTADEAVSTSQGQPFDYVIITAKAIPSTPSIPEQIRPAISEGTTIALVQNGVAIEEPYATAFPTNPLLSCVVYLPSTQTAAGVISHREVEMLHIGPYPTPPPPPSSPSSSSPSPFQIQSAAAASTFSALLRAGGASTTLHTDIQPTRWGKLLVNASWNPVCALSLSRDMQFLHSAPPYSLNLIKSLMTEIVTIAQALGYDSISNETVEYQIGRAQRRSLPGIQLSMLADARAGRAMEVDAIVGNAVRIAEEKGVDVPLLKAVYALVRGLDGSFDRDRREREAERKGE